MVFASPEINAFALPGNRTGVFEGMFAIIDSPDQLAAVVGHEIGHVGEEHSQERMTAQITKDLGLRLITLLLHLGEVEDAADIAAALGLGAEYGLVLPYSRHQELEADHLGLELMGRRRFRPGGGGRALAAHGGGAWPGRAGFLSTHPTEEDRIEAIEAMFPEIGAGAPVTRP